MDKGKAKASTKAAKDLTAKDDTRVEGGRKAGGQQQYLEIKLEEVLISG